ncbi:hypothetical protein Hanom_Chr04g00340211 [Helianthus anomalus]
MYPTDPTLLFNSRDWNVKTAFATHQQTVVSLATKPFSAPWSSSNCVGGASSIIDSMISFVLKKLG